MRTISTIKSSVNTNTRISSTESRKGTVKISRKNLHSVDAFVFNTDSKIYLSQIERFKEKGFVRDNIFGKEIIWNGHRYIFPRRKEQRNMRHLFIFSLTKRDAVKWIAKRKASKSKWLPSVKWNDDANITGKRIIGTDIDGAYWKIAYQLGIISDKTYQHGLRINNKMICLAALSSLGADKRYRIIRNGRVTDDMMIVKGDDALKEIYKKIRLSCFHIMQTLAKMLGNDFICYKTDCIYYIHTARNTRMISEFLTDNELDFKMVHDLTYSMSRKY